MSPEKRIVVLPASGTFVEMFAKTLRQADRDELHALDATACPEAALRDTVALSSEAWMAIDAENPQLPSTVIAMWGYREYEGSLIPWLLGSDHIVSYPATLVRFGREYVAHLDKYGKPMWNVVWVENVIAQSWLEVIGFTIDRDRVLETPSGGKFYRFTRGEIHV